VLATPTIDWRILRGHSVSMTLFKRSRRKRVTPDPEDAVVQRYPDGAVVQRYSVEATSSIYYATIHGLFPHPGIGDNNGPKQQVVCFSRGLPTRDVLQWRYER